MAAIGVLSLSGGQGALRDRALDIATIAICTGLSEDEVRHLAAAQKH